MSTMAINRFQLRDLIARVLIPMRLHSSEVVDLLMGTCAQESQMGTYLRQLGGGPALGIFQMEPSTFLDLRERYGIRYGMLSRVPEEQEWDLKLAILMARIKYLSCPGAIPKDVERQARYWKQWYNTALGAGTVDEYLANYRKYCQ